MANYPYYQTPQMGPYGPQTMFYPNMGQAIPQQPIQQPVSQTQQSQCISAASRPVSNRDEANAVSADFSGALMLFPDVTHNRVYVKRWDIQAGAAVFLEYEPVEPTAQKQDAPAAPSIDTTQFAKAQDMDDLKDSVDKLRIDVDRLRKSNSKAAKRENSDD